jgi:hypothetical protein
MKSNGADLQVSPNPIKNGSASVLISNMKPGRYTLNIIGYNGKLTLKKNIDITEETSVLSIPIETNVADKGIYVVQLKGDDVIINKKVLIY